MYHHFNSGWLTLPDNSDAEKEQDPDHEIMVKTFEVVGNLDFVMMTWLCNSRIESALLSSLFSKSRLARNEIVYFYWTNRRDDIDTNKLHKDQITNHFAKADSFATKVLLCCFKKRHMRIAHPVSSCSPSVTLFLLTGGVVSEPEERVLV